MGAQDIVRLIELFEPTIPGQCRLDRLASTGVDDRLDQQSPAAAGEEDDRA
jgi:hypothetical protein